MTLKLLLPLTHVSTTRRTRPPVIKVSIQHTQHKLSFPVIDIFNSCNESLLPLTRVSTTRRTRPQVNKVSIQHTQHKLSLPDGIDILNSCNESVTRGKGVLPNGVFLILGVLPNGRFPTLTRVIHLVSRFYRSVRTGPEPVRGERTEPAPNE